jgi:alanyl-tRNA synthetase
VGLRKATDREGTVRIISIEALDRSACGGTHVRTTGEIGPILIGKLERVRKQVRLEFGCGARALRRARANQELLQRLALAASTAPEELPALFEAQRAELKAAHAARREAEARLHEVRAQELYAAAPVNGAGIRRVTMNDAASLEQLRSLAQSFTALPHAVFVGVLPTPPTVLLAASADADIDAGAVLKRVLGDVGGRGGGNARFAQGTVPSPDALERAVTLLAATA